MSCAEEWKRYRVLRWQAFFAWLGGCYLGRFPIDISHLYYVLFKSQMATAIYWTLYVLCVIVAFTFLIITWSRVGMWPCPRCQQPYFGRDRTVFGRDKVMNVFRRRCAYCALRKWHCD